MEKPTLISQLDNVLYIFSLHDITVQGKYRLIYKLDRAEARKLILRYSAETKIRFIHSNLNAIFDKLIEDKFLIEDKETSFLTITFLGRLWLEQGGYQEKMNQIQDRNTRVETLEENQRVNTNRMTYLTIVLSAGCIFQSVYYIADLKQKNLSVFSIEVSLFLFVFVAGLLSGICTLLIVKEVLNRKKGK